MYILINDLNEEGNEYIDLLCMLYVHYRYMVISNIILISICVISIQIHSNEKIEQNMYMYILARIIILKEKLLTRFITNVRSPSSSSSGVGGSGRFGAPPRKMLHNNVIK